MPCNYRFNSTRAGLGGEGGRLQEQDQPAADGAQENQLHLPLPRPTARRINNDSHRRLMPELLVASPIENWLSFWCRGGGGAPGPVSAAPSQPVITGFRRVAWRPSWLFANLPLFGEVERLILSSTNIA